jgi:hypothetical protein
MQFKTRVDLFYKLVVVFLFLSFGFILFNIDYKNETFSFYLILSILFLLLLFFLGTALTTKFTITSIDLICGTFFWRKYIPLNSIRKVEKQIGLFAGWKLSTAFKGVIVHYNKYDELLISPEKEADFIEQINLKLEKTRKVESLD